MNTITAINPTHQRAVTKCYGLHRDYQMLVNKQDECANDKELARVEKAMEKTFECYLVVLGNLPQREINNYKKQHKNIHGYEG